MQLYNDSRASLKSVARNQNLSFHRISTALEELESKYEIYYTLNLDEMALGFPEGRLMTIKFKKMPSVDFLKDLFKKDIYLQNAYLATGDFDLLLHVVGLSHREFQDWQFTLRVKLASYGPNSKFSTVDAYEIGFFPLKNDLLEKNTTLDPTWIRVLKLLNENSRIKFKDIVKKSGLSPRSVVYIMKQLEAKKIIRKYSALIQNVDKKLTCAYGISVLFTDEHQNLFRGFAKELMKEDFHESTTDYAFFSVTSGGYDLFAICSFKDGEVLSKRGPELIQNLWTQEEPKIDRAILTGLLVGKWPFHLENYSVYRQLLKEKEK